MRDYFEFPKIIKLTAIVKFDEIFRKDIEQVSQSQDDSTHMDSLLNYFILYDTSLFDN